MEKHYAVKMDHDVGLNKKSNNKDNTHVDR